MVLGTTVIFPQSEKWEDLENLYIYFKSIKTGKGILDKIENTFTLIPQHYSLTLFISA